MTAFKFRCRHRIRGKEAGNAWGQGPQDYNHRCRKPTRLIHLHQVYCFSCQERKVPWDESGRKPSGTRKLRVILGFYDSIALKVTEARQIALFQQQHNPNPPTDFQRQLDKAKRPITDLGSTPKAWIRLDCDWNTERRRKQSWNECVQNCVSRATFDVAQNSSRADYDRFFYRELSHRAHRIYLFRDEYFFNVEKAVVVETPQLGHATYVFAKPRSMDSFLALYTYVTKDDIWRNRNNAAERLGFLGRAVHSTNPRGWH